MASSLVPEAGQIETRASGKQDTEAVPARNHDKTVTGACPSYTLVPEPTTAPPGSVASPRPFVELMPPEVCQCEPKRKTPQESHSIFAHTYK